MNPTLVRLMAGKEISVEEAGRLGNLSEAKVKFPFKYITSEEGKLEHQGGNSKIYLTDTPHPMIAKGWDFPLYFRHIKYGYVLQKEFKKRGVKVANPRGIYNVFFSDRGLFQPCLIMEFAPGKRFSELEVSSEDYKIASEKVRKEAGKLLNLGHKSYYARYEESGRFMNLKKENILYDPETMRVTLVDFDYDKLDWKILERGQKGGK